MSTGMRVLRSGEAARRAGVSADTLRYYERRGLIPVPPRSPNGYRVYSAEILAGVRIVRRALDVGFTLSELAALLGIRARGGHPCRDVRTLAREKLRLVEERLTAMSRLRSDLRRLLRDWDRRLKSTPRGKPAYLLATLPPAHHDQKRDSPLHRLRPRRTSFKKEQPS